MLLGCIADDFTGASDLANTLSKNGMLTIQFNGVPSGSAPACEAGVVSLKSRSAPVEQAVAHSLQALDWLMSQGCEQFFFKYCSTFDSTEKGNIGPVAEALLDRLGADQTIFCPAFPKTGRTLYQGHLFVNGALLNESGMEKHPLTPMTDPNLVRWLQKQATFKVGGATFDAVRQGHRAIAARLEALRAAGTKLVVVDALDDADLFEIGKAVAGHRLVTGGSGVAMGLPANFAAMGKIATSTTPRRHIAGPAVVLSGSCSVTSQNQLTVFLGSHPGLLITADDLLSARMTPELALRFVRDNAGKQVAVYSSADAGSVAATQARHGREAVADVIETFFGKLASLLAEAGVTRFVVGGGETSGAVVKALGLPHFQLGPEVDPGVPVLYSTSGGAEIGLALKSGNFGAADFYEKAIKALA